MNCGYGHILIPAGPSIPLTTLPRDPSTFLLTYIPADSEMLIGLSILFLSASFLFYRHPPTWWRRYFLARPPAPGDKRIPDDGNAGKSAKEENKLNKQPDVSSPSTSDIHTTSPAALGLPDELAQSPETTPKVIPSGRDSSSAVPSFSLENDSSEEEDDDDGPPPSFPALNSAQRAYAGPAPVPMGPPPIRPVNSVPQATSSQLMPPPSMLPPRRTPQSAASGLRVPPTGPVPNRGPPAASGLSPSLSTTVKTPNPRQKVMLRPGYSPLDWATLIKSGQNLSGVSGLVRVTPSQLKSNNGRKGRPAWSSYQGKVYNITPYLPYHPGGEGELRRAAGKDGGKLFMEVHPWVNWENMLGECLVGIMVGENEGPVTTGSSLDDMD